MYGAVDAAACAAAAIATSQKLSPFTICAIARPAVAPALSRNGPRLVAEASSYQANQSNRRRLLA